MRASRERSNDWTRVDRVGLIRTHLRVCSNDSADPTTIDGPLATRRVACSKPLLISFASDFNYVERPPPPRARGTSSTRCIWYTAAVKLRIRHTTTGADLRRNPIGSLASVLVHSGLSAWL